LKTAAYQPKWSQERLEAIVSHRLHWLFLATSLIFIGFYGVYTFLGVAIFDRLGLWPSAIGLFVGIYGAGFLVGTLNTSLVDRLGYVRTLILAATGLALILTVAPHVLITSISIAAFMFIWGIFQVAAFTSLTSIAGSAPKDLRGLALALNSAAVMIGASLGAASMSYVFNQFGFAVVGLLCGTATLAAVATAWCRIRPSPRAIFST